MFGANLLFVLFTILATVGAYLVVGRLAGRRAGIVWALILLVFFVTLYWALATYILPEAARLSH